MVMPTATAVMPIGAVNHAVAPVQTIIVKWNGRERARSPDRHERCVDAREQDRPDPRDGEHLRRDHRARPLGPEEPRHDVRREHDQERQQWEDQRRVDPQQSRSHLAQVFHARGAGRTPARDPVGDVADLELVLHAELVHPPVEPDLLERSARPPSTRNVMFLFRVPHRPAKAAGAPNLTIAFADGPCQRGQPLGAAPSRTADTTAVPKTAAQDQRLAPQTRERQRDAGDRDDDQLDDLREVQPLPVQPPLQERARHAGRSSR